MKAKVCLFSFGFLVLAFLGCAGSDMRAPMPAPTPPPSPQFLYVVNTISATISGFSINATSGALTQVGPATPTAEASIYAAATPNGKFLYVATEDNDVNGVSGFVINPTTGVLTPTSPATFGVNGDSMPFGITIDPTSTHVYTANARSISAFKIDSVSGALSEVPGTPVSAGNEAPQTLTVTPNGKFLYTANGPTGTIATYTLDANGLPHPMGSLVGAGNFPIGIVVDPSSKFAYVANWLSGDVTRYTIAADGTLVPVDNTLIDQGCGPQELALDPSAHFLYVSCPGTSTIAQFAVDSSTGALTPMLPAFSPGAHTSPRGIVVDASGKFVYSALNTENQVGGSAIGAAGGLTSLPMPLPTGRGPLGVAISTVH